MDVFVIWLAWFAVALSAFAATASTMAYLKQRRRRRRRQQRDDDFAEALGILAVFARGPELPVSAYRRVCQQYLDDHGLDPQVTLITEERQEGGGAVH